MEKSSQCQNQTQSIDDDSFFISLGAADKQRKMIRGILVLPCFLFVFAFSLKALESFSVYMIETFSLSLEICS